MKVFTYSQYIKCIHTFRLNAILQLAEEGEEYKLEKTDKKDIYDKLVKHVLQDKKEVVKFINQFIEPREKIKEEELIRYTNKYITKKYKSRELDLVYKLKNQDLFFLIEHKSKIDNSISYKMLNYCLDIMQECGRNKKIRKTYSYPIIVPIVIYTGNEKWRFPKNIKEKQINNYYLYQIHKMDLDYNFIDINKIPKQILLQKGTMFMNIMLIKKSKDMKELIENLESMIKVTKDEEKLNKIANLISNLLDNVLEENIQQEILEKIERKIVYLDKK